MDGKTAQLFLKFLLCLLTPGVANAASVELSAMLALTKSEFSDGYKSETRRYTGSVAFKFTAVSALEFEYTDSLTQTSFTTTLGGLLLRPTKQEVTYKDQIYSFNWVQNLVSSKWILQPYFVIGGGRMTRKVTITLPEVPYSQNSSQNVTQGTGGLGLRIFLTKAMAIKAEVRTYVPDFKFSKWKETQMTSVGLSWMF